MNFLETIIDRKRAALEAAKRDVPIDRLKSMVDGIRPRNDFKSAVSRKSNEPIKIIAEIKRASPSKGMIAGDINPIMVARDYETGGASGISILTERDFFKGSIEDLQRVRDAVPLVPLLRKDFIVDEYQIYESLQIGADAVLLIVAALDQEQLKRFMTAAKACGLASLVEVHSDRELDLALAAGADIIGVNNRNLITFEVSAEISGDLARKIPEEIGSISESGIHDIDGLRYASDAGYDAALIGEYFMRSKDRVAEVRKFAAQKSKATFQNSKTFDH